MRILINAKLQIGQREGEKKLRETSSVYDCTVEDVEYYRSTECIYAVQFAYT
jgi:hypothetical protein